MLEELKYWNELYETKFGFKFVVFVNGRPRSAIVPVLQERYQHTDKEQEMFLGLSEMMAIAMDRLDHKVTVDN